MKVSVLFVLMVLLASSTFAQLGNDYVADNFKTTPKSFTIQSETRAYKKTPGKLIRSSTYTVECKDGVMVKQTYKDSVFKKKDYNWTDIKYTYDENKNLVLKEYYAKEGEKSNYYQYTFDDNCKVKKEKFDKNGKVVSTTNFECGICSELYPNVPAFQNDNSLKCLNKKGDNYNRMSVYSKEGILLKVLSFPDSGIENIVFEETFYYNNKGLLEKKVTRSMTGRKRTTYYTYNSNGDFLKHYDATITYEYDSNGNWIKKSFIDTDAKEQYTAIRKITY